MNLTSFVVVLLLGLFSFAPANAAGRKVIFKEDFERPDALKDWQLESNGGRMRIAQDSRDSANHGLLMDDPTDDAIFSQNVASRSFSIAGHSGVRIAVDIYSYDDEVQNNGKGFDGVALRVGDTVRKYGVTGQREQHLEFDLDYQLESLAKTNDQIVKIELHQYDNFSVPSDGLFFDNVTVTAFENRDIYVEAPLELSEADPLVVTVVISPPPLEDVALNLVNYYAQNQLFPAVYPSGALSAELSFPSFENNRFDGDRYMYFRIAEDYFYSDQFSILIKDNEPAGLSLTVPDTIKEGESATGVVSISAAHDSNIPVSLESSAPSILTYSSYVEIPYYSSSVGFTLNTSKDRRVLPNREVVVSVVIGGERVEKTVKILETESLLPTVAGPTNLVEGSADIPFTVHLDAGSDQTLTVHLSASPSTVSLNPTTLTFKPGQSLSSFKVSVAEDTEAQANRSFVITAQLDPDHISSLEGTILDNDMVGFKFDLADMIQADTQFLVGIKGVNQSGDVVDSFKGRASVYLKNPDSSTEQLLLENIAFVAGKASITLNLPFSARTSVLLVRSPDGISSTSHPLKTFAKLIFAANDLVYDPKRELLYAVSGGSALPGHLHSVTKIKPSEGLIGEAVFLGGDPRNEIITDDGKYLYVGLGGTHAVKRVNLATFTPAESIVLTSSSPWQNAAFSLYGLLAIPGRPLDFIASQFDTASSYNTTRAYFNGVVQPASSGNAVELVPGGSPNEFYAFNSQSSYDFMRFRINGNGFEVVQNQRGILFSGSQKISGEDDLIFSNLGRVVDGLKMETVADLKLPMGWTDNYWQPPHTVMTPDTARSRVFYAHGNSFAAFDTGVFQLVTQTTIPNIGNIIKITRWGDTGLALLTENAELVLLEDKLLVPSGPSTDLSVMLTASPQPAFVGGDLTYSTTIQNKSDTIAPDVRLIIDLASGQTVKSISNGLFAYTVQSNTVSIQIGDMAAGSLHHFTVTTVPTTLTTLVCTAGALTTVLDRDYANNRATSVINVAFKSTPNSVNVVKIPINDVIPEPNTGKLIVSVAASAPSGLANRILVIDPTSGLIEASILVPGEPTRLAVSDDGTTAYALDARLVSAFKVNFATRQFSRTITFSVSGESIYVSDIKVLHGTTDSIIIAGPYFGARVYDNGVPHGPGSGSYQGDRVALLPDPTLVIAYNSQTTGYETFKYKVSPTGVSIVASRSGLVGGYYQPIKSDGYFVYSNDGSAVRADIMAFAGSFDVAAGLPSRNVTQTPMEPDRAGQRVYFASDKKIASFDSESYLPIRTLSFNLPAAFTSLERWGTDGFAARLDNGDLAIIRTELISQTTNSIDLLLSVPDSLIVTNPMVSIGGQAFTGQGISKVKIGEKIATSTNGFTNWTVVIDQLAEGENVLNVTATALGNPAAVRTLTRTIFYQPQLAAYGSVPTQWIMEHFGRPDSSDAYPQADPDHDGLSNVAEHLFGTNPLEADHPHFSVRRVSDSQYYLDIVHLDSANFTFVVESSADVLTWNPSDPRVLSVGILPISGSTNYVTESYRFTASAPTPVQFFRVRAVPQ